MLKSHTQSLLAITIALLATACGRVEFDVEEPAVVAIDAGATDETTPDTDAGTVEETTPEPEHRIGDPCYCCVWAPGTSYPDGDVYCMTGKVDIIEGLMCRAAAGDGAPEWAPKSKGCVLSNPWGKPE